MKKRVFRDVRYCLYLAFALNGIVIQWIAPFQYKCNFSDEKCLTCGLRTAINLILQGRFYEAYQSNKLIIAVVIVGVIMVVDVLHYLCQRCQEK